MLLRFANPLFGLVVTLYWPPRRIPRHIIYLICQLICKLSTQLTLMVCVCVYTYRIGGCQTKNLLYKFDTNTYETHII